MPQRLTALEVSLLALDTAHTPSHIGAVHIFDPGTESFDYERLIGLIQDRIAYVPRYRQRVLGVPARLAGPVWVDDEGFDLTFHVRRSAVPRPGTPEQLREFVGRILARRLDRSRPLWEVYLVEGLAGNQFALVSKTHLALVDGVDTVDIGQVLLDSSPDTATAPERPGHGAWQPVPEPSPVDLVLRALWENVQDPALAVENLRGALAGVLGVAVAVGEVVGGIGGALGELAGDALRGPRPVRSPLAGLVSEQRRFATVSMRLADLRSVRAEHSHTINDAVLAVVTGGLRSWLLTRGESIGPGSSLTALVPMSVAEDDVEPTSLGSQVAPHLQRLPIGETSPLIRLHQIAYATQAHKDTGRAVDARSLSDIAGFAPTTLHALGVRVSAEVMRKQHDLLVTNVPGPQVPLYAAGARLAASYPALPLSAGHLLTIGVTSYDGEVFLGLTADRDAIRDLDVLAQCLTDALEELLDTTVRQARVRQPTRKATPAARRAAAKKSAARQEAAARKATGQKRAAVRNLVAGARRSASRGAEASAAEPSTSAEDSTATTPEGAGRRTTAKRTTTRKAPATRATGEAAAGKTATEPATDAG